MCLPISPAQHKYHEYVPEILELEVFKDTILKKVQVADGKKKSCKSENCSLQSKESTGRQWWFCYTITLHLLVLHRLTKVLLSDAAWCSCIGHSSSVAHSIKRVCFHEECCRNYRVFFHTVSPVTVLFLFTSNLCCSLWRWEAGCMKAEILMDDDKFMWLKKMCFEVSSVPAQLWRTYIRWAMLWMRFTLFCFRFVDGTLNLKILHPHSSRFGSFPGSMKRTPVVPP